MMLLHMRHAVTFFMKLPCIMVKDVNTQNMLQITHVTLQYNMDASKHATHSENKKLEVLLLNS